MLEDKLLSRKSTTIFDTEKMTSVEEAELSTFFSKEKEGKISEGSPIVQRGSGALYKDFPEGKANIFSWNMNSVN